MALIDIKNLTFCYDGSYDNIFENVSFQIDSSWRLGFTGRNGRGKTTFLNLLLGEYEYSGDIISNIEFEYFPYRVSDYSKNTFDIIFEITKGCEEWKIALELNKLELSEDVLYRPFSTLSNGEQTKILLIALFLKENNFLLIDEPTNHLDTEGRELVGKYLKSKSGFILVSHDRDFLDSCIDHILSINKTNIEIQQGNFSSWYYNKQLQDNYELSENQKLSKDIRRLKSASRQSKQWADKVESTKIGFNPKKDSRSIDSRAYIAEQSRRMQQRRKNLEARQNKAIEEKSSLLKNIESYDALKLHPLTFHSKRLIDVNSLSLFYDDKKVCDNISFSITSGEQVSLKGKNGCGKSSILKLIVGESIDHIGSAYVANGLKISYIPQSTQGLFGTLDEYALRLNIDISLFKTILRKLDFSRTQFEKKIEDYSEGQKKKVLIAGSLSEQAHLYIWDEPLNYIDVFSRIQIENLINEYKPTLLFVEHDSAFCNDIASKIIDIF